MKDFRKLDVWQHSYKLTISIYKQTKTFPKDELFGLTSQMRRAAVSVIANIAEGCGRKSDVDFARFLHMAFGSASELECHLLLSRDLGYLKSKDFKELSEDTVRSKQMLSKFISKLKADS
jgi:four helix bundle protein